MKDTKINLRISEEVKSKLDVIAQEDDDTVSDVIRKMIDIATNSRTDIDFNKKLLEQKEKQLRTMLDNIEAQSGLNIAINSEESYKHIVIGSRDNISLCVIEFEDYEIGITPSQRLKDKECITLKLKSEERGTIAILQISKDSKITLGENNDRIIIIY